MYNTLKSGGRIKLMSEENTNKEMYRLYKQAFNELGIISPAEFVANSYNIGRFSDSDGERDRF